MTQFLIFRYFPLQGGQTEEPRVILHPLVPATKRRRCQVCKKQTRLCCSVCSGAPNLHKGECEITFHNATICILEE